MRAQLALAALLAGLAGCGGDGSSMCTTDSQCGGNVCARDGECLPAASVRMAKLSWTIRGMPASAQTCATSPNFSIYFDSSTTGDSFGFDPVPCQEGQFTIDKLPDRFDLVEIDLEGQALGVTAIAPDGTAAFDLSP